MRKIIHFWVTKAIFLKKVRIGSKIRFNEQD